MNRKLQSRLLGEITKPSDMQRVPHLAKSKENLKRRLMRVKGESEKAGLKLSIKKTKIKASSPITSWQIDEEIMETVTEYFFFWGGLQNHYRW